MDDALGKAPVLFSGPAGHRPSCCRECGALSETQREAANEKRCQATGGTGQRRGGGDDCAADRQGPPRPKFIANPSAKKLKQRVWNRKRGENESKSCVAELQFRLHERRCRGNVRPIDEQHEIHCTKKKENEAWSTKTLRARHEFSNHDAGGALPLI